MYRNLFDTCSDCQLCPSANPAGSQFKEIIHGDTDAPFLLFVSGHEKDQVILNEDGEYSLQVIELFSQLGPKLAITTTVRCDLPSAEYNSVGFINCSIYSRIAFRSFPVVVMTQEAHTQLGLLPFPFKEGIVELFDYTYIVMVKDVSKWENTDIKRYCDLLKNIEPFEKPNLLDMAAKRKERAAAILELE